ncbi:MAG: D-alanyl-D-alanine carboxypeptidase [Micavibrio aeruginosavorus]|uniref:serine-type D-Ala-D-Ala carboxypeptidase n=1 Tax=Micavibrio aeruginosavorus TaxID=349221 RepID=A0A2W5FPD9_9BACT|nr:MAG: D-alanyl-D-alanine carboxypeptidase [Micavibrio aeruginosavorus]
MKIKLLSFLSVLLLASSPALALEPPTTLATQAFAMDYETGAVLYDKDADVRMATSSMSKVLTSMVAFDAVKSGTISMEQELPVSEKAWRMQGSKTYVDINKPISVSDLIHGVIIQSGNDACIVLAEGIAGTEESFAEMLNKKATELGMKNSHFVNASGWPDPEHYSTPRDLAIMARALIHDYPEEYPIYSMKDFTYNNIKQGNRNPLLYSYPGTDGVKTGHAEEAGYGVIGSAVMNGRRVILVINGTKSMQERADESRKLMDWTLRNFKNVEIAKKGKIYAVADVVLGLQTKVPLTVAENVKMTLPQMAGAEVKVQASYSTPLKAPVKAGEKVGKLVITIPNLPTQEIPLITAAPVEEKGMFARTLEKFLIRIVGTPKYS